MMAFFSSSSTSGSCCSYMTPLLVAFFFVSLSATLPLARSDCHPQDRAALLGINKSLNGAFTSTWNQYPENCCMWFGATCNGTGRIVELHLNGHFPAGMGNFSGGIPSAIARLTALERLLIRFMHNLSGPIPSSLATLVHLNYLAISKTNVSGPIPSWIGRFAYLTILDLSFNSFSGPILPTLANLPKITAIVLNDNRLSGPIPDSFGRFTGTVPRLYLMNNQLTSIPGSMGNIGFVDLQLQNNLLAGDASQLLKNRFAPLQYLDLTQNRIEFDLSRVVFPLKLRYLSLAHNKLYGRIPREIADVAGLLTLDLSYNGLCGSIPQGGPMKSFSNDSFIGNKCLCGAPLSNKC